jgi:hypothetical protein
MRPHFFCPLAVFKYAICLLESLAIAFALDAAIYIYEYAEPNADPADSQNSAGRHG